MSKPTYVLGTGLSHDGSACLLKDGRVCVAIEKERLTRVKHDGGNDALAIQYCLDAEGIRMSDLTLIVQNALHSMFETGNDWFRGPRTLDASIPCVSISHHLAHAYGAAGTAPFAECSVLVIDGSGSSMDHCLDLGEEVHVPEQPPAELRHGYFEKDSYYRFDGGKLRPVFKDFSPWGHDLKEGPLDSSGTLHSIGGLYWAASIYAFGNMSDPGKLMGLAPYGRKGLEDRPIFDLRDGRVFVHRDWMRDFREPSRSPDDFKRRFQYFADFARWVQQETERAVYYVMNSRYTLRPSDNLAYCGGVALNAVANGRIVSKTSFKNVYIQPAAGDNGVALGCAYYGWLEVLGREPVLHDGSPYLARSYSTAEVRRAVGRRSCEFISKDDPDYVQTTADLLASGRVVGWFQGGAEFGPRALGHRSILALPNRPGTKDFINHRVKRREDFRPFAPSVPLSEAPRFFESSTESPYMILTVPVRPEHRTALAEVVHVDGSSRIHTVTPQSEPAYHELLKAVGRRTGVPVLLNTSLNRKGQPIVETPEEAVEFLLSCELDAMIIGTWVLRKRRTSAHLRLLVGVRKAVRGGAVRLLRRLAV